MQHVKSLWPRMMGLFQGEKFAYECHVRLLRSDIPEGRRRLGIHPGDFQNWLQSSFFLT